jgi:hypothetical protein
MLSRKPNVLLHNGQKWGQYEYLWEDDTNAPPEFKRVQSRPLTWTQRIDADGTSLVDWYTF